MCTVSWLHEPDGYQLFCNRDEKRARKPALAPEVHVISGTRFVAPLDGDFGGTWIGANEFGVSVCLLNRYADVLVGPPSLSRGHLVLEALGCGSIAAVIEQTAAHDLRRFAPFTMVALEAGRPSAALIWNGRQTIFEKNADALVPLVSSSFDQRAAEGRRKAEFRRLYRRHGAVNAAVLDAFHSSHLGTPSADSPCMHRDDAETVSFTRVTVRRKTVSLSYSPASPCRAVAVTPVTIPR